MPRYRSLLLGCGPRATEHVDVYRDIDNMEMVAVCDLLPARRQQFMERFGIDVEYDDYETALAQEQPDIVHICTSPGNRVWEAECAAKAGVKVALFEKPVAIRPADMIGLRDVLSRTDMKVAVNCQRRYFPQFRDGTITRIMKEELGEVYFIRASTKGNTMGMGPHTMSLLKLFLEEADPVAVWAMAHTINEESYQVSHKAPESIMAQYWFPGDVRVVFDCDPLALGTPGETSFWMHLHFDVLGTKGRLFLTQNGGYWYQSHGMAEPVYGESSWDKQGWEGQRDMTRALADWIEGGPEHLNSFAYEGKVVDALLAAQKSVYEGTRVELPAQFTDAQWEELRERLRGT